MIKVDVLDFKKIYLNRYSKVESFNEELIDVLFKEFKSSIDSAKNTMEDGILLYGNNYKQYIQDYKKDYNKISEFKTLFLNNFNLKFRKNIYYNTELDIDTVIPRTNETIILADINLAFSQRNINSKEFIPAVLYLIGESDEEKLKDFFIQTILKSVKKSYTNILNIKKKYQLKDVFEGRATLKDFPIVVGDSYGVGNLNLKDEDDVKILYNLISNLDDYLLVYIMNNNPSIVDYYYENKIDVNLTNFFSAGLGTRNLSKIMSYDTFSRLMHLSSNSDESVALSSIDNEYWGKLLDDPRFKNSSIKNKLIANGLIYNDFTSNYSRLKDYSTILNNIYIVSKYNLNTKFDTDFNNWDILKNIIKHKYKYLNLISSHTKYNQNYYLDYLTDEHIDSFIKNNIYKEDN